MRRATANPRFAQLTQRLVGARGHDSSQPQKELGKVTITPKGMRQIRKAKPRGRELTSPSNIPIPGMSGNAIGQRKRKRRIKSLTEKIASKEAGSSGNGYGGEGPPQNSSYT